MRIENDPGLNSQSFNDHGIFTINELNELFPVVKPYFSALHLNIRSLNQHFADLCNLLDSTPLTFDFIGCSETWLSSQSYLDCFTIPGYVYINDNRTYSSGGGAALYTRSDRNFHLRDELRTDTMQNVWIETQDLIIGVI